jgi:uncharacterized repeat protein (TIGR03803 family)
MKTAFSLNSLIFATVLSLSLAASASETEKVIHGFQTNTGDTPFSTLVFDSAGNLYGTTEVGGESACGCGTVFQLTPTGGGWKYRVIHTFQGSSDGDGGYPAFTSGLVLDKAGNVYGTTVEGGASNAGSVFEVSPNPDGAWTEKIIHSFSGTPDGSSPQAGLAFDAAGNLYGTTVEGGSNGAGAVFELSPTSGGGWSESVIHSFSGADGSEPYAPPTVDAAGNLYGTTCFGGADTVGTVFKLSPQSGGGWAESVLYSFTGKEDGGNPQAGLLLDSSGNLDGVTFDNQTFNSYGVVFRLTPNGQGGWTESILHSFTGTDGEDPRGPVSQDAAGNLYATTYVGGANGGGTVVELSPHSKGGWTTKVVFDFLIGTGGWAPIGGVIPDSSGRLYGTTAYAMGSGGVVFELQP